MTTSAPSKIPLAPDERPDPLGSVPYVATHIVGLIGAFIIPPTWELVLVMLVSYWIRMFAITAGYHRYFAHRAFKTGRIFQAILAFVGTCAAQKGVLWWSGMHRHHHKHSDTDEDMHSPRRGFLWSHTLWILCDKYLGTPSSQLKEFEAYPELVWMNRFWIVPPLLVLGGLYLVGGWGWFVWGGLLSTVLLWHGTFTINSLSHLFGTRRYDTQDTSRNNFWLALLTLGEGWHNNHHFYQSTARNGFFWWEIDVTYYVLKVLSWFGVVWDLRQPPRWVLEGKAGRHASETSLVQRPAMYVDDKDRQLAGVK